MSKTSKPKMSTTPMIDAAFSSSASPPATSASLIFRIRWSKSFE